MGVAMSTDESDEYCGFSQDNSTSPRWHTFLHNLGDDVKWAEDDNTAICLREPWRNHDRCIWHAKIKGKPADDLAAERTGDPELLDQAYLVDVEFDEEISFAGCYLRGANLTNTKFRSVNLTNSNLHSADLTNSDLGGSDLNNANLYSADLTNSYLVFVDLTKANLNRATLNEAIVREADLTKTNLHRATLIDANLREATLNDSDLYHANLNGVILGRIKGLQTVNVDNGTIFSHRSFSWSLGKFSSDQWTLRDSNSWNDHARDAHKLAGKCSEEGLISQARTLTIMNRHALRNEKFLDGELKAAITSWLNWQATGYGLSIRRVGRNMIVLFIMSTAIYLFCGIQTTEEAATLSNLLSAPYSTDSVVNALYFSVITFTTAPPETVSVGISQWVAMAETFLGTLLIVLLGYVLGNRERI